MQLQCNSSIAQTKFIDCKLQEWPAQGPTDTYKGFCGSRVTLAVGAWQSAKSSHTCGTVLDKVRPTRVGKLRPLEKRRHSELGVCWKWKAMRQVQAQGCLVLFWRREDCKVAGRATHRTPRTGLLVHYGLGGLDKGVRAQLPP